MAKKIVENQQLMSAARAAINDNFTELYDQAASSGGSSGSDTLSGGGIGSLDYIKNLYSTGPVKLEFTETLPDAIVAKDGDSLGDYWDQVLRFKDIGISGGQLQVYYGRDEYTIWFDLNTPSGDYISDASVDEDEVKPPDASLKDYIDEGRALYYGGVSTGGSASGGSSSTSGGGIGLSSFAQEISNFDGTLPDYIVNGHQIGQLYSVSPTYIYYLINPIDDQYIGFNNNAAGTRHTYSFPNSPSFNPVLGSLQEYVDSPDRAIYLGGSSSGGTTIPDNIEAVSITGGPPLEDPPK